LPLTAYRLPRGPRVIEPASAWRHPGAKAQNERLTLLRDHDWMRTLIWIVGLLAIATSLDSSLYGGLYTRAAIQMFTEMALHMKLIG